MYSINRSNDKVDWKRKMGSAKHFSQGKTGSDYKKEETVSPYRRGLQGPKKICIGFLIWKAAIPESAWLDKCPQAAWEYLMNLSIPGRETYPGTLAVLVSVPFTGEGESSSALTVASLIKLSMRNSSSGTRLRIEDLPRHQREMCSAWKMSPKKPTGSRRWKKRIQQSSVFHCDLVFLSLSH